MNGNPGHTPHNMSGPPRRSGSSPAAGLVPAITSSLRSAMMYNHNALTQAISQIEAIGDIQNELVNARSAHAQASKDIQVCMERNAAQSMQLQRTQDELRVATQNLHGAREQLKLLEARLAAADGRSLSGQGAQQAKVQALETALNSANQKLVELTRKFQMATSAAIAAQHSDNPDAGENVLAESSTRAQVLERRLITILGLSDQDIAVATSPFVEALTRSNASTTPAELASSQHKMQIFAHFKALRSEFDAILGAAQSYTSRNAMLEATLSTIRDLHIGTAPIVTRPTTEIRPAIDRKPSPQDSPVGGEIEMDVERTEAARVARQNSSAGSSAQPQPVVPQQRPPSMQPQELPPAVGATSLTPTQPTFFPQGMDSPQRKRQRTSTNGGTPEPLPRDDLLHVYVRLVTTTYKIQTVGGAPDAENTPTGQKELICKLCESRHKDQPNFPVAAFPYDRDTPLAVPSLAEAESTRTLVKPWIDHIQQQHQKIYNTVLERMRPRSSTTASASSVS